jgi:phosphoglycerate kinase
MDDYDFRGKRVLLRSDLDSPYDKKLGQIMDNERLEKAAESIKELSDGGTKVIVFGHQGRPGKSNFTTTQKHAELLSKYVGKQCVYIEGLTQTFVIKAIQAMQDGDVIVLENTRFSSEEMLEAEPEDFHTKTHMIITLEPLADYYIDNAFTNAHRQHCSMVGFLGIPNLAGRQLAAEVAGIAKASSEAERPYSFILGGVKIFDYFTLIGKALENDTVDHILCGGALGELCLLAKGYNLGAKHKFFEETDSLADEKLLDLVPQLQGLMNKYPDKWEIPEDLACDDNGKRKEVDVKDLPSPLLPYDIGSRTAERFARIVKESKTIFLKGPMGMYENPEFSLGSKIVFQAATEAQAFSLIGGGDSAEVAKQLCDISKFSHVSLAGGATLKMLAGKKLIAIKRLENSYEQFKP